MGKFLCACYLENVRQVSQVEDVVEAYRSREEVLTDFLVQTDGCLDLETVGLILKL